jgi:hypothetical protein
LLEHCVDEFKTVKVFSRSRSSFCITVT